MGEIHTAEDNERMRTPIKATHAPDYSEPADGIHQAELARPGSFLSSWSVAGRANASRRAASMLKMQKTYGNRSVQRFVQRSPARSSGLVPVQRGDPPGVSLWPYPTLDLPFGPGTGIAADPSAINLNWNLGGMSGKLGYEYEGNLTGEANVGDYWLKGGLGKKGFGLGLGYGNPLITPPGIPPMGNDPSGDLRGGDLDPRTLGKSLGDMKDSKVKPGWSWGLQGGKDEDKGYYGWGGLQYNW